MANILCVYIGTGLNGMLLTQPKAMLFKTIQVQGHPVCNQSCSRPIAKYLQYQCKLACKLELTLGSLNVHDQLGICLCHSSEKYNLLTKCNSHVTILVIDVHGDTITLLLNPIALQLTQYDTYTNDSNKELHVSQETINKVKSQLLTMPAICLVTIVLHFSQVEAAIP